MYISRQKVKDFLRAVEWAKAEHFIILKTGTYSPINVISVDLCRQVKQGSIKKLKQARGETIYADLESRRYNVGSGNKFDHDVKLRECLARFFHDHNLDLGKLRLSNDCKADAFYDGEDKFYFEFDSGNEDGKQLEDKFKTHYTRKGKYRIVFFMASRYNQEESRLNKLFEIVRKVRKDRPNQILGACYTDYLKDGKIYNLKGEETLSL